MSFGGGCATRNQGYVVATSLEPGHQRAAGLLAVTRRFALRHRGQNGLVPDSAQRRSREFMQDKIKNLYSSL